VFLFTKTVSETKTRNWQRPSLTWWICSKHSQHLIQRWFNTVTIQPQTSISIWVKNMVTQPTNHFIYKIRFLIKFSTINMRTAIVIIFNQSHWQLKFFSVQTNQQYLCDVGDWKVKLKQQTWNHLDRRCSASASRHFCLSSTSGGSVLLAATASSRTEKQQHRQ